MGAMTITQAHTDFSNLIDRAFHTNERTIIAKKWKNIAAIIGMEDFEYLENISIAEYRVLAEMADEAMTEPGENISLEEMKKHFGRC